MLRINLLPPYIYEGNKRRNVTILWVAILALVVGGMVFAKLQIDAATEARRAETEALRPNADRADALKQEASNIEQANQALKAKSDFVEGSNKHVAATYPPLFDNIRNWTITRVLYRDIVPQGQAVTINAHAPSLSEVGHYMLAMERNPNITGMSIGMNSIPSFGPNGPIRQQQQGGGIGGAQGQAGPRLPGGHDFTVSLALAQPIPGAPSYPAGGGGGGQQPGMGGGMGGPMGGMGGGPPPGMAPMGGGPPPGAGPMGGGSGGGGMSMGGRRAEMGE